jgi:hypothetical protein
MKMALVNLMVDPGPDIFYNPEFRNVLEDHMTFLRENHSHVVMVRPDQAFQWRGDFFGLLGNLNQEKVPRQYHWLVMRLNQYTSPTQFTEDTPAILVPDYSVIEKIAQSHNSLPRIS